MTNIINDASFKNLNDLIENNDINKLVKYIVARLRKTKCDKYIFIISKYVSKKLLNGIINNLNNISYEIIDINDEFIFNPKYLYIDMIFSETCKDVFLKIPSENKISIGYPSNVNLINGYTSNFSKYLYHLIIGSIPSGLYLNDCLNYLTDIYNFKLNFGKKTITLIDEKLCETLIKPRVRNSNKGTYLKTCIFGGCINYSGSIYMSRLANIALNSGAGYVSLAVCKSLASSYLLKEPQATLYLVNDNDGYLTFDKENIDKIIKSNNIICFGMGVGISDEIYQIVLYLIRNFKGVLIIDADGINCIAKYGIDILNNKQCQVILTPHIGEFSRLINKSINEVLDNQIELAKEFVNKYDVILCLKSSSSIICDKNSCYLNITGNSSLAKCGSGDMLVGIISGLISNTKNLIGSCIVGSYILGKSAELACKRNSQLVITYTDVIKNMRRAIFDLYKM